MKSSDAKRLKEYDILSYNKGFISTSTLNGVTTTDYFLYSRIYNLLHHPNIGIEVVSYNGNRRVF